MMKRTADAVAAEAARLKIERPRVIAVTVLTSMDQKALTGVGVSGDVTAQVVRLALLAKDAGLDGVVASAREIRPIRDAAGPDFLIVTPGVRPAWAAADDQKRVATPKEAITDGADFIVVGRPVAAASDPLAAAKRLLEEID